MLADCWPRKFGGRGRDQKSCCVLRCCLVWEGQAFRQHGNQHMESWPIGSLWFVLRHVFCPRFEFFFPFKWYSFYVVVLECDGTMFPLKPCIICRLSFQGGWERHPYRFIFRGIYISPFFFFVRCIGITSNYEIAKGISNDILLRNPRCFPSLCLFLLFLSYL